MSNKPIDLAKVRGEPVIVKLPSSGKEVSVLPMDGWLRMEVHRLNEALLNPELKIELTGEELWSIAARLMPEATKEEIAALTPPQIAVVIRLSASGLDAVEELLQEGKGADPATEPGLVSPISTAGSSSESPEHSDSPSPTS